MIKKIAILTSGGDAPGMNNAIRAVVKEAQANGIEAFLVFEGYKGLHSGDIRPAVDFELDNYLAKGGTFIYSARYPEFKKPEVRMEAKAQLDKLGIDALVVIGGDGSYQGAQLLHEIGVKTIGLPGTIDNDISSSDFTIGYDTALNTIVENVDRVRDTMTSHDRCGIVEVMGHGCGDLALFGGMATGAEVIVTNEYVLTAEEIGQRVKEQHEKGKRAVIVLVAEKIFPDLNKLAETVEGISGKVTRAMSLSHSQRGGVPTAQERINATRMGIRAVRLLREGHSGLAVGIVNGHTSWTPIMDTIKYPEGHHEHRERLTKLINKLNQA